MPNCVNHPGKEGIYRCARCKRYFCTICVELIGDKAYCYECLKEIVRESREEARKGLTLKLGVGSVLALLIALASLRDAIPFLLYVYKNSVGFYEPYSPYLIPYVFSFIIGLVLLALSLGLATTSRWAYRYGIAITFIILVINFLKAFSTGMADRMLANPYGSEAAFFGTMVLGPFLLFAIVLISRKELLGW
ncbi:MAG: hypothetical protein QXF56_03770 [Candidatus Micrarchaeia archaeon]